MKASFDKLRKKNGKVGLAKRLGVVIGIIILLLIVINVIAYATRPQIHYSLAKADCSPAAIAVRNKALGANLKSCVIIINAHNVQPKAVDVNYDADGFGGGNPLIRIYTKQSKFCYALLAGEGNSFIPKGTNQLTLRCGLVSKPPKNYDTNADASPTSIVIAGYSGTTIEINPTR